MSIPFRNEDGIITFVGMAIKCKEIEYKRADKEALEYIKCVSNTVKPECDTCSIINSAAIGFKNGKPVYK